MANHLSTKVSLFLKGVNLPNKDLMSKSDCFAVVYIKSKPISDNEEGEWEEVFRTKTIVDNNNPQWPEAALLEYHFEDLQQLRFEVYDRDSKSEDLKKQDFIGFTETTMSKIMGSKKCTFSSKLRSKKGREMKKAKFVIIGQEAAETSDAVEFEFRGAKLDRKNFMGLGKSDPFYVICQRQPDGTFVRVFEGEVIKGTLKPNWKPQIVPLQVLCNGDVNRGIRIDVFDWESGGDHKFIGCCFTSVKEMMEKKEFNLISVHVRTNKKSTGTFIVEKMNIVPRPSFLRYIERGCELRLSVAIDFTGSNGHPSEESSLHYMHPGIESDSDVAKMNEYQKAILGVGQILQDYDTDQMIPAYGFGAEVSEEFDMFCFPLTLDQENVEVHKVGGILRAYNECLKKIELSGPTNFAPVIQKALDECSEVSQENQSYNILLIITDGEISDMPETIAKIIEGSHKALSIIIVGVGNADFTNMERLDGDDSKLSLDENTALRDIVQFVPFRKFQMKHYTSLAEEVLKEIPEQVEDYFRRKGINPM